MARPNRRGAPAPDLPWAAYARHSDRKQERSVLQQLEQIRGYAAENHLALPAEYVFTDEAKTGRTDAGRDGLMALMALLERRPRPVAGVLLWASSRLARDVDDAAWYRAAIRHLGYKIHYVGDPILNAEGPERHVFEALYAFKDQKYSEDLAREVVRGMHDDAKEREAISRPPRGYAVAAVDGRRRFVIDPEWEARVRQAWALRAAGYSISDVHAATRLYTVAYGYSKLFRNRTYLGTLVWGGVEYPGFCEPLCTPEQWEAVRRLDASRPHPRQARSTYLLSGLVTCACGHAMQGNTQTHPGRAYRYYRCRPEMAKRLCNGIRADLLDQHVAERAQGEFTPETLAPVFAAWQAQRLTAADLAARDAEALKLQLLTAQRAIDNLVRAIEAADPSRTPGALVDQLAAREAELAELRRKLATARPPADDFDLAAYCARIQAKLASPDENDRRVVLREIVERVTVRPAEAHDRVHIAFNHFSQ